MTDPDERQFGRIRKNRCETIVVRLKTHVGRRFIDLRVFKDLATERGCHPTRVGIAIRPEFLRSVIEALEQAETAAQGEGLIEHASDRPVREPRK